MNQQYNGNPDPAHALQRPFAQPVSGFGPKSPVEPERISPGAPAQEAK
jgi:hypothetical protein